MLKPGLFAGSWPWVQWRVGTRVLSARTPTWFCGKATRNEHTKDAPTYYSDPDIEPGAAQVVERPRRG